MNILLSEEENTYFFRLNLNKNLINKINNLSKTVNENRRVFDCVIFHDELHLLLLRFEEYYEYVDYFVVVEIDKTHRGHFKLESNFLKNKNLFKKYEKKILFKYVEESPIFINSLPFLID